MTDTAWTLVAAGSALTAIGALLLSYHTLYRLLQAEENKGLDSIGPAGRIAEATPKGAGQELRGVQVFGSAGQGRPFWAGPPFPEQSIPDKGCYYALRLPSIPYDQHGHAHVGPFGHVTPEEQALRFPTYLRALCHAINHDIDRQCVIDYVIRPVEGPEWVGPL